MLDPNDVDIRCALCGANTDEILAASALAPGTEMGLHGDHLSRVSQILTWINPVAPDNRTGDDAVPYDPTDPEHIALRTEQEK